MAVFDVNGNDIGGNSFLQNVRIEKGYYGGVQYYLIHINKKKYDGTSQYPFVIAPNGMGAATQSALEYAVGHNYPIVINSGVFDNSAGGSKAPLGMLIVNGQILNNVPFPIQNCPWQPLLINSNGDLSAGEWDTDATELTGIVSAVCGCGGTLVENYIGKTREEYAHSGGWDTDAQRMVIGQFANGDYAIIASEARGFDNTSPGWTVGQLIDFCKSINLKFAFNLDGGGSSELVVGKKQLNTIYENTYGRIVPTFIVFNGTTTYGEPED